MRKQLASRFWKFGQVEQAKQLAGTLLLIPSFNKFVGADVVLALFQLCESGNLVCVGAIEHLRTSI